jgi:copper resistance protein D
VIDPLVAVRTIHLASTIAVAGASSFSAFVIGRGRLHEVDAEVAGSPQRDFAALLVWLCLAASLVSAVAWLVLLASEIADETPGHALRDGTVAAVLTDTQFGRILQLRLSVTAVLAGLLVVSERRRDQAGYWLRVAVAASAGILIGSLAWIGHAGAGSGAEASLHLFADVLHLLGAGAWLGGLFPLAFVLWRLRGRSDRRSLSACAQILQRFSNLGIVAVAALFVSGVANTWFLTAHMQALVGTAYGQLLQIKIALFLAMVGVAADNRLRLLPRIRQADVECSMRASRQMRRNTMLEIVLGLAVICVVAVLGITAPGGHVH